MDPLHLWFMCFSLRLEWKGLFIYLFWLFHMACGFLMPWPGIKPLSPALEVQILNHWTTREVPDSCTFKWGYFYTDFQVKWVSMQALKEVFQCCSLQFFSFTEHITHQFSKPNWFSIPSIWGAHPSSAASRSQHSWRVAHRPHFSARRLIPMWSLWNVEQYCWGVVLPLMRPFSASPTHLDSVSSPFL